MSDLEDPLAVSSLQADLGNIPSPLPMERARRTARPQAGTKSPASTTNKNRLQTVNPSPEARAAAPDTQPWTAGKQESPREQTIVQWSVVGRDRLIGTVYGHASPGEGRTVMTSPVVQVRLTGAPGRPVAFTESGSAYRLGKPAESFGQARAERFVADMARRPTTPAVRHPGMVTAAVKLVD